MRSTTTTVATVGQRSSAVSSVGFSGRARPRRLTPSAVTTSRTPASTRRAATASAPKPEKTGTYSPPTLATAYAATTASAQGGKNTPTASPLPIPRPRRTRANRATAAESSA
jgi:hypothetical protein